MTCKRLITLEENYFCITEFFLAEDFTLMIFLNFLLPVTMNGYSIQVLYIILCFMLFYYFLLQMLPKQNSYFYFTQPT